MRLWRPLTQTCSALSAVVLLALAPSADGSTHYVANNGTDSTFCGFQVFGGFTCGAKETPCRSISCAIREADPGDTILVGPGRYGDLNHDGALDDDGDEFGSPGCDCLVGANKPLLILSTHGAASTVIGARHMDLGTNVSVTMLGGEFGRPGNGFTVTNTARDRADGIVIDGANVRVRGNIVAASVDPYQTALVRPSEGIRAGLGGPVVIEGNLTTGIWENGIVAFGTGKIVRKNQVSSDGFYGIFAGGDSVVQGNVVTGDSRGIGLDDAARAVGNAVSVPYIGIVAHRFFTGVIEKNNLVGNGDPNCGLYNDNVTGLIATNNYWGAATGPGADPADEVCNNAGTTVTTPFATKPFSVSAPIKP